MWDSAVFSSRWTAFSTSHSASASGLRTALEEAGLNDASTLANYPRATLSELQARGYGVDLVDEWNGKSAASIDVATYGMVLIFTSSSIVLFYGIYLFRLSFLASQSPPVVTLVPVFAHASNHRACPSYGHEQVWRNRLISDFLWSGKWERWPPSSGSISCCLAAETESSGPLVPRILGQTITFSPVWGFSPLQTPDGQHPISALTVDRSPGVDATARRGIPRVADSRSSKVLKAIACHW